MLTKKEIITFLKTEQPYLNTIFGVKESAYSVRIQREFKKKTAMLQLTQKVTQWLTHGSIALDL